MYYTLSKESKDVLAELSETGMGYQLIEWNGHTYLVLNNEYVFLLDDYFLNSRYYILSIDQLKKHYGVSAQLDLTTAVVTFSLAV